MSSPRILLVGHGAREAALARSISQEAEIIGFGRYRNPLIQKLSRSYVVAPAYTSESIVECARNARADCVMIGPEEPIAAGAGDELEKAGYPVFAPSRRAALLEADKIYMREFLSAHLPDLNVNYFVAHTVAEVKSFFEKQPWPVAVKPKGLTGGKGVRVEGVQLSSSDDAAEYATKCLERTRAPVLLEERLDGVEFTLHSVADGTHAAFFRATYDYSYRDTGDRGPQTGGMGSYCDSTAHLPFMSGDEYKTSCQALSRVLQELQSVGIAYRGILQGQFFLTKSGLKICEFACRLGDPEAVNLITSLESSWVKVMDSVFQHDLSDDALRSRPESSVALCLVPPGYPDESVPSHFFSVDEVMLSRAGVTLLPGSCEVENLGFSARGGRAATLVGIAPTIQQAREVVLSAVSAVSGLEYRQDVAAREDIDEKVSLARKLRAGPQ